MSALGVGFENGREVTIGDAKVAQIAGDVARMREREIAIELQSIGCAWDALCHPIAVTQAAAISTAGMDSRKCLVAKPRRSPSAANWFSHSRAESSSCACC